MKKAYKIIIVTIAIIFVIMGGFLWLLFSYSDYKACYTENFEAAKKIREAEKNGALVELSSSDINEILGIYLKKGRAKGNILIKGMNVIINENEIAVKVPLSYKKVKVLLSSKGELFYENSKVIYKPKKINIGRLNIPVKFALENLRKLINNKISEDDLIIEKDKILISKSLIPFSISKLSVENGRVIMYVEKFIPRGLFTSVNDTKAALKKVEQDLNKLSKVVSEKEKGKINKVINEVKEASKENSLSVERINRINEELVSISQNASNKEAKKEIENIKEVVKNVNNEANNIDKSKDEDTKLEGTKNDMAKKQEALSKVYSQLSGAAASLQNSEERAVIDRMLVTIGMMQSNPTYNYGGDEAAVRRIYGKLKPEQKKRVKSAIYSSVDSKTILEIKNAFGI